MAFQLMRCSLSAVKLNPLARYSHHAAERFANALRSAPIADLTELDNGIKVATEKTNSLTTTFGVFVEAGPQSESKELNGITNFIERMLFKGSKSRSKPQLEQEVYELGAVLNSFTNRDNSGLFATVAPSDTQKAIEIIADLIQKPALNSEDIEETRNSILNELAEIENNNSEQLVFDYLHSVAYQETPLAFSKYGTTENIKRFTRADIEKGLDLFFKGPRIVIAASGDVNHAQIVKSVDQAFKGISINYEKNAIPSLPEIRYTGSDIRVRDDSMNCAQVALAVEAPGYSDPNFVAFEIASSLMGSWDLTQGGGMNVDNYMGPDTATLAQSIRSFNLAYKDTALFGTYFVGERMQLETIFDRVRGQWNRLCFEVANNEVNLGKNPLLTKLIIQREGSLRNANSLASDIFRFGRRVTLEEWKAKIDSIDSQKMRELATNYILDRCPVVSALGPVENLPLYEEIRMKMVWSSY